jgi:hypothetical protein
MNAWQAGQDGRGGNAKIKVQNAKLWNPDVVGLGVLVVASFSISRILYLLDVYYIRWDVGCQVNFWLTTDDADCHGLLTTYEEIEVK